MQSGEWEVCWEMNFSVDKVQGKAVLEVLLHFTETALERVLGITTDTLCH